MRIRGVLFGAAMDLSQPKRLGWRGRAQALLGNLERLCQLDPESRQLGAQARRLRERLGRPRRGWAVPGLRPSARHLAAVLSEDFDAETGDVLLQLSLLGEIKYG